MRLRRTSSHMSSFWAAQGSLVTTLPVSVSNTKNVGGLGAGYRPSRNNFARLEVYHANLICARKIDVHFLAGLINGHRFGVTSGKHDVANVLERLRVNDIEGVSLGARFVAAAFDVVVLIYRVKYRAVHARGKLDGAEDLVVFSAHQFDHSEVIPVRHDQLIDIRQKNGGVRLTESSNAMERLSFQVKYLHGLMILGCKEQAFAFEVYREMVEVA